MKLIDIQGFNIEFKKNIFNNVLYQQLLNVRELFIEVGLDVAQYIEWGWLNTTIRGLETGTSSVSDRKRGIKLNKKYGSQSYFRIQWVETKEEREMYRERICYANRMSRDFLKKKTRSYTPQKRIIFVYFLKASQFYIRWLYSFPLTFKQKRYLWRIERKLGIFYEDLPLSENGLVKMRKFERRENE